MWARLVEYSGSRSAGWLLSALPLALLAQYYYSAYMRQEVDRQTGRTLKKALGTLEPEVIFQKIPPGVGDAAIRSTKTL